MLFEWEHSVKITQLIMFEFTRKIHVYETDLMGIVHHSNYLRFCEEARVEWCFKKGLIDTSSEAVFALTVVETNVKHVKPARYGDFLTIQVQVKSEGVRLYFQYLIKCVETIICKAETIHCSLDTQYKVKRLDQKVIQVLEKEKWIETWL